jgi:hypothetical protein
MMRRIIVHQWDKKPGDIDQSKQGKKKDIGGLSQNGAQTKLFCGKVTAFYLQ